MRGKKQCGRITLIMQHFNFYDIAAGAIRLYFADSSSRNKVIKSAKPILKMS